MPFKNSLGRKDFVSFIVFAACFAHAAPKAANEVVASAPRQYHRPQSFRFPAQHAVPIRHLEVGQGRAKQSACIRMVDQFFMLRLRGGVAHDLDEHEPSITDTVLHEKGTQSQEAQQERNVPAFDSTIMESNQASRHAQGIDHDGEQRGNKEENFAKVQQGEVIHAPGNTAMKQENVQEEGNQGEESNDEDEEFEKPRLDLLKHLGSKGDPRLKPEMDMVIAPAPGLLLFFPENFLVFVCACII
jgi:hypothetical protein